MHNENSEKPSGKDDILAAARKRFELAAEASKEARELWLEDHEFISGQQWPERVRQERDQDARPSLTINRLPQLVRAVVNDVRQNRPSIKVYPVDDKADVDTARILQGMVKHIEANSCADVATDTGVEAAARGGFGYWRVTTEYCDTYSFDQEILIKRIPNALSVYFDPYSMEPDGSDAAWAMIVEDMSHDEFKAQYPESELTNGLSSWQDIGNQAPGWIDDKSCRVAEYFYREYKDIELVLLSDGHVYDAKDLGAGIPVDELGQPLLESARRKTKVPVIKWAKISPVEILEETDWPGKYIPIVPVYGDELNINGKRIFESVIRHAKDSQRMYNYWASSETELIALAPRAPYIGVEGQFEGHEQQWAEANRKSHPYLEYKDTTLNNGQMAPPPQRQVFDVPTGAITNARMQSADDLKATTGVYDAAVGARSNENSGVAIQRRNMQAQTVNFHFVDNLTRSMRHTGRILVDLIPKIYDTPRAARIIGEEGEQQIVTINALFRKNGETKAYDLGAGKYDVVCDVGPSFATKRQEAVQSMLDMTKAYPKVAEVAGDLMIKNMDWPGAKEVAERLKKTLPPGLADSENDEKKPIPPEIQAQMQQMSQMIEQLTATANESAEALKTKKLELESKERIEMKKLEVQVEIAMAELDAQASSLLLKQEVAELQRRQQLLRMNAPIDSEPNQQMPDQQMLAQQQPTDGFTSGQNME